MKTVDAIVQGTKSEHHKFVEESDDDDDSPVSVTNREVKKCINALRRCFMQEGNERCPTFALNIYTDFVEVIYSLFYLRIYYYSFTFYISYITFYIVSLKYFVIRIYFYFPCMY